MSGCLRRERELRCRNGLILWPDTDDCGPPASRRSTIRRTVLCVVVQTTATPLSTNRRAYVHPFHPVLQSGPCAVDPTSGCHRIVIAHVQHTQDGHVSSGDFYLAEPGTYAQRPAEPFSGTDSLSCPRS